MLPSVFDFIFLEKKELEIKCLLKMNFRNWKKALEKFNDHVGKKGCIHKNTTILYLGFKDQRQSVTKKLSLWNEVTGAAYRMCLTASVDVARLLLGLGLAFCGNDESLVSKRKG